MAAESGRASLAAVTQEVREIRAELAAAAAALSQVCQLCEALMEKEPGERNTNNGKRVALHKVRVAMQPVSQRFTEVTERLARLEGE
jgi:hypothetical protein